MMGRLRVPEGAVSKLPIHPPTPGVHLSSVIDCNGMAPATGQQPYRGRLPSPELVPAYSNLPLTQCPAAQTARGDITDQIVPAC